MHLTPDIMSHYVKHKYYIIAAPEALNAADVTFSNCTNSNIIIHIHRSTSTPVDGYLIWIDLNNKTVYNETISPVSEYTCVKVTNLSVGIRYDLAVKTVLRNISIQRHFYTGELI